jgi:DNA repair protein RecN (Recombination protein N)
MLRTLRIRHLAVIEDLEVEFGPGLNVLTGETGAGKSILVGALGLAVGDRADSTLVRAGAERAVVEAEMDLEGRGAVASLLESRGIDVTAERTVIVRREVAASGGGRVFLNGSPSTVAVLREVGGELVELHGQHEHQSLLSPERHQALLDQYAGCEQKVDEVEESYRSVTVALERRERLRALGKERDARRAELRRQAQEIDAAAVRPGEIDAMDRERRVLQNAGRVSQLLDEAVDLLYDGEPAAASMAAGAARRAAELASLDPALQDVADRIGSAQLELQDAGAILRDYRDRASFDPGRLEAIEARRAVLDRLLLTYGRDEAEILRAREAIGRELATLENLEDEATRAAKEVGEAEDRYLVAAGALSRTRRAAAGRIGGDVETQLRALALERAKFDASLSPARGRMLTGNGKQEVALHPRGAERVEFLLAANPGEDALPLGRVASGGELSRVMLALHMILERAGEGRVLVFDEVDAGIGGAVADAVGSRLARLAALQQVLCVTHLPQVAAHADRHYHVRKRVTRGRTRVEIALLPEAERLEELARMLGGKEVTPASRRNAAELMAAASGPRARARRGA